MMLYSEYDRQPGDQRVYSIAMAYSQMIPRFI